MLVVSVSIFDLWYEVSITHISPSVYITALAVGIDICRPDARTLVEHLIHIGGMLL